MIWRAAFKQLGVGLLLATLFVVVVISGSVIYLGSTTQGLQQLVRWAEQRAPGELKVGLVDGTLFDRLTLQDIHYQQAAQTLSLKRFHLAWAPAELINGTLHILALEVEQPALSLPASEPAPPSRSSPFPIRLPDVTLPIALRVDALAIQSLSLITPAADGNAAPPLLIDRIGLQVHSEQQTLVIDRLQVSAPQGALNLSGQLTVQDNIPLSFSTDWQVRLPDYPPLNGRGTLAGTLDALTLQQQLSGLLDARIQLTAKQLLAAPQATVTIDTINADLGLLAPALKKRALTGRISAEANLEQLQLDANLRAPLPEIGDSELHLRARLTPERLRLAQLQIARLGTRTQLRLSGDVTNLQNTPTLAIKGNWHALAYPLRGSPEYSSPDGRFTLSGTREQYRLGLDAALAAGIIPAGQWQLTGQGNAQGLKAFTLNGTTLQGQVEAEGALNWSPSPDWRVTLKTQDINPGVHWPDWPGQIALRLHSAGSITPANDLQLNAELASLTGNLRGEPLKGNAKVQLKNNVLTIERLHLNVASAELDTRGTVADQLDLDWALNAPSLAKLLPDAQGKLTGAGTLRGNKDNLLLNANLEGQSLRYQAQQIEALRAELAIDLSGQQRSILTLNADRLNLNGQRWRSLSLRGTGVPAQHQLELALNQGPVELQLALSGGWNTPQWLGQLTRLELDNSVSGPWRLRAPAEIQASDKAAQLSSLCMERQPQGSGELCLKGGWSGTNGIQAALELQQLPLALLEPWLPPGTRIDGELSTVADLSQERGQRPNFTAHARLHGTELRLEEEDLNILSPTITLDIVGQGDSLRANLHMPLQRPDGGIEAQLDVKDLYRTPNLEGNLVLTLKELNFISLFTPQLQAITGNLDAQLHLSGHANAPQLRGHATLSEGSVELPALGIKLDDIALRLQEQTGSSSLQINGSLRSGEGTLTLNGSFDPLKGSGNIALQGERVQAVATHEVKVWVSPAIQASISPELIQLRGEVLIPEAKIKPPPLPPSTAAVSPDVVILDPEQGPGDASLQKKQRLDAKLRVSLGDKVLVDALGFKGRLQGSILLEDDGRRATRATGTMQVAAGQYRLYGQDLNIERGSLLFSGGPVDNPGLDLRISRKIEEVTAGARVSGTLRAPRLRLFSEPAMPESSLLSYLMFGRPPGADNAPRSEQALLLQAASSLALMGGNNIAERISDTLTLDDLGFESGDSVNETSLFIGKYLSPRLYVKYGVGLLEPTNTFFMRYRLSKRWSLESQTGSKSSGGDLIFTLER